MKLNKKLIWYSLPILVGGFLIYKQFKKPKKNGSVPAPLPTPPSTPPSGSTSNDNYPLRKGSKGSNVRDLQNLILKIDNTALPKYGADGDFGSETEAAVVKLLNKKVVEWSDYAYLLNEYNKKSFPLLYPKNDGFSLFDPNALFK